MGKNICTDRFVSFFFCKKRASLNLHIKIIHFKYMVTLNLFLKLRSENAMVSK